MANRQKWAVQANSKGQTVSRHVMRRLMMKADNEGLISDWDHVQVQEDGSLYLYRSNRVGAVIAVPKGQGRQVRWVLKTPGEVAAEKPAEVKAVEEFAHDQHVLDGNANG